MKVARTAVALLALAAFVLVAGCGGDPAFTAGKVYLQQKDYENAVEQLKTAIKNSPDAWEPHMWLGRTYAETDRLEEASEHLHIALDRAPDEKASGECRNAIAYYTQMFRNEGNNKMEAAQYEMALAEYEKAIIIDPHNANSLVNLGAAYQNIGDYDAAIAAYEEAQGTTSPSTGARPSTTSRSTSTMIPRTSMRSPGSTTRTGSLPSRSGTWTRSWPPSTTRR